MRVNPVSKWFRPKRIGFGWSPASPEGWAVTLGSVLVIVAIARTFA